MSNSSAKNSVTISRGTVEKKGGVVVLPLREYERLKMMAIPTYQLKGKDAKELDKLVKEGLRDYEMGRTVRASSLKEALKAYDRRKGKKN